MSAGPAADVRAALEARQVRIYFAAVAAAAVLGWLWPSAAALSAGLDVVSFDHIARRLVLKPAARPLAA